MTGEMIAAVLSKQIDNTISLEPCAVRLQMLWDNLSCVGTEALALWGGV